MLRELRIGFGHLGHIVQLIKAYVSIIRIATTREDNFDVLQGNILYLAVFQSDDAARGDVARQVFDGTFVFVTSIGLGGGDLAIEVLDGDAVHKRRLGETESQLWCL